jgi:hypothetical protein
MSRSAMKPRRRHTPRWMRDRCAATNQWGKPCPWLAREGGRFCVTHEKQAARRREAQIRATWRVLACLVGEETFPSSHLLREQLLLRRALRGGRK